MELASDPTETPYCGFVRMSAELQQVQFSGKHISCIQSLGSGDKRGAGTRNWVSKKNIFFWSCPHLHNLMGTETDQQGLISHRVIALLSKLLASRISPYTSCFVTATQLFSLVVLPCSMKLFPVSLFPLQV